MAEVTVKKLIAHKDSVFFAGKANLSDKAKEAYDAGLAEQEEIGDVPTREMMTAPKAKPKKDDK